MKYLRKYNTLSEFVADKIQVYPNVGLIASTQEVIYNNAYNEDLVTPLYIYAVDDITIKFNNIYEYSRDMSTWDSGNSTLLISASVGEKIYFRAANLTANATNGIGTFVVSNGAYNVGGNIMSMIYGSDFIGKTTISAKNQFRNLFNGGNVISAAKLQLPATSLSENCYWSLFLNCSNLEYAPELPATTLAPSCYSGMFQGCPKLKEAPLLPATILVNGCYNYMFYKCFNLKYIKALFTTTPGELYTKQWVEQITTEGLFVKNAEATWNVTGTNGIPENWTIKTAEA